MTRRGLGRAVTALAPLFAAAGFVAVCLLFVQAVHAGRFGFDYHGTMWEAGRNILHGRTPYPRPDPAALEAKQNPALYPAPTLVAAAPLALLPATASAALWDALSLAALLLALRLVGVRDWRVYAVVLLSCPAFFSFKLGQLDSLQALGCALAWRWRRCPGLRLAVCVAAAVTLKLFLWPLLVWLAAIGRRRAALGALALAAAAEVAGWAVVGTSSLRAYPHLLRAATTAFGADGYSLMALGTRIGISGSAARMLPVAGAVVFCAGCVAFARRDRDDDALAAAVGAGLLGSPILWFQYLLIPLVVLAIKRPRLSAAWAVPGLLWLAPSPAATSLWLFVVGFGGLLALLAVTVSKPRAGPRALGDAVAA